MARSLGGIFCLESDWENDLRSKRSVLPILELLERLDLVPSIHRSAATPDALAHYLRAWSQKKYQQYPLLYLATHGSHDVVELAGGSVDLDAIGDVLEGRCADRTVYFAGCSILNSEDPDLTEYVRRLGARAVVGYDRDVDWLQGAAFELLLLTELVQNQQPAAMFKRLQEGHPRLVDELGLVVATKSSVYRSA